MDFTEKKSLFTQIKFLKTIELQPNWFNQMKIHWVLLIATEQKQNNVLPNLPIKKWNWTKLDEFVFDIFMYVLKHVAQKLH